ncbi:hypothetical protein PHISCL_05879 [Aspergillus sclerotialis]|uniref:Uncharacterized protein n=1 Tax=Aspergillus sclerotialis TaxID=2070753 RepID=A0A3A2ZF42_9EURO|nr:hypothetical protein PHISCL_05879 [Aspergillus sclerotialis]
MVQINISTTTPVNPPSATPKLSHSDLWKALVSKARQPEEFVAVIDKCRIVSENPSGLRRAVLFKGEENEVEEDVRFVKDMKIDFHVPATGQAVSNIISGLDSDPEHLMLTFTFEWPHPGIKDDDEMEIRKLKEKYEALSRNVVPHTVAVARKMVVEGRLG